MGSKHCYYRAYKNNTPKNITTHALYALTSVMTVLAPGSASETVGDTAPSATQI